MSPASTSVEADVDSCRHGDPHDFSSFLRVSDLEALPAALDLALALPFSSMSGAP